MSKSKTSAGHTSVSRRRVLATIASAAGFVASTTVFADTYPSRPITLIVPYAAGGPTDTLTRIIAEPMRIALGQTIVVENAAGGAGSAATQRVQRADPDGYTVIVGNWGTHVINGAMQALKYDLHADFEPISLIADNPHLIVSKSAVPATDLKGLITWAKANGDKLSAANSGAGSPSHLSGLQFQKLTGTMFPFVSYRGSGPALQDLMAGHIDLYFDQISNSLPAVQSGQVRAYAIAAPKRSAAAPEIPTVDEAGLPGFHISVWHAAWVPKGTPKAIVDKLNAAVGAALNDPSARKRLADLGQEVVDPDKRGPQALGAFHKAEIEKWWPLIKAEKLSTP